MKFKFPLQKVLEHRKLKENLVQKEFQDALNELMILQNKKKDMESQADEARVKAFQLQETGGTAGPALVQINEFLNHQKTLLLMHQEKIRAQEIIVEEKRELLQRAATETKVIAKFKEKKFEEFREKVDRDEQKEMDEQSVLRFKHREE